MWRYKRVSLCAFWGVRNTGVVQQIRIGPLQKQLGCCGFLKQEERVPLLEATWGVRHSPSPQKTNTKQGFGFLQKKQQHCVSGKRGPPQQETQSTKNARRYHLNVSALRNSAFSAPDGHHVLFRFLWDPWKMSFLDIPLRTLSRAFHDLRRFCDLLYFGKMCAFVQLFAGVVRLFVGACGRCAARCGRFSLMRRLWQFEGVSFVN